MQIWKLKTDHPVSAVSVESELKLDYLKLHSGEFIIFYTLKSKARGTFKKKLIAMNQGWWFLPLALSVCPNIFYPFSYTVHTYIMFFNNKADFPFPFQFYAPFSFRDSLVISSNLT